VPRWQILLGKNLALLPFALGIGLALLLLVKLAAPVSWLVLLAACLQLLTAFLLLSILGNLISPLLPCRIAPGALRPTKQPASTTLMLMFVHAFFPMTISPILLPPLAGYLFASAGWLPAAPMNLLFSTIEFLLLAALYGLSLPSLGNLLQHREKRILQTVTQEVE
jgi:ABC-2 type transport system permease protein